MKQLLQSSNWLKIACLNLIGPGNNGADACFFYGRINFSIDKALDELQFFSDHKFS